MEEICEKCGLPKDICVCGEIAKEAQKIKISVMQRRPRKFITTITGFEKEADAKELEKKLKRQLACGGTTKGSKIELQGDHKKKVKEVLLKEGYREDLIDD